MSTRTDIHKPSAIVPADYTYCDSFSFASSEGGETIPAFNLAVLSITRKQGGKFAQVHESDAQCDICGAWYVHGDLWLHEPTNTHITIGQQCASKMGLVADRNVFKQLRDSHVNNVMQLAKRRQVWRRLRAFMGDATVRKTNGIPFRDSATLFSLLKVDHHITRDIRAGLIKFGSISAAQVALLEKLEKQVAEQREREATEAKINWIAAPEGRMEITGKVVHTKYVESGFGYGNTSTLKMLVVVTTPEGSWKCWGTCPRSLEDRWEEQEGGGSTPLEVKGNTVKFTATLQPSDDDKCFAFFKRPSKAEVL